jgi:hypothetical protein
MNGFAAPKLPAIKFDNERVRYLSIEDQNNLLDAYIAHVRPIALIWGQDGFAKR